MQGPQPGRHWNRLELWREKGQEKLGLIGLVEKWPAGVYDLGQVIGGLTVRAAEHLGLPQDFQRNC